MNRRRGFTFLELLVVMALIGSLSAIAVPRYRNFKERSYVAVMRADLSSVRTAEEAFWSEHMRYSLDSAAIDFHASAGVHVSLTSRDLLRGYTATATHAGVPGVQCTVRAGPDAAGAAPGSITCGAAGGGSGGLSSTVP